MSEFSSAPQKSIPLRIQHANVYRGQKQILRDINLELSRGERLFLVGPNGAGKTTLCRAICGLLPLTSGQIELLGAQQPFTGLPSQMMSKLGVLIEQPGIPSLLRCLEWLTHHAQLHNVPDARKRAEKLLADWEIPAKIHTQHLSLGLRQRLHILRTLIHSPEFLIWDEPTATLDPAAQAWLWNKVISWQNETSATIIICTHHLEEAFTYADSIAFLSDGVLKEHLEPQEIIAKYSASRKIHFHPNTDIDAACQLMKLCVPGIEFRSEHKNAIRFTTPNGESDHPALLRSLIPLGLPVLSLENDDITLREIWETVFTSSRKKRLPSALSPQFAPTQSGPAKSISLWSALSLTIFLQLRIYSREKRILIPLIIIESFYLFSLHFLSSTSMSSQNLFALFSMAAVLPIGLGSSLAADSFAGERERKSLEVALTQPISFAVLLIGKLVALFIATLGLSWIAGFLALWQLYENSSLPFSDVIQGFTFVYLPGALLCMATCVMAVSARARSSRTAAQAGGLLVIPLIGITQWLASGLGAFSSWPWISSGLIMTGVSSLLLAWIVLRTKGEKLLDP